MSGDDLVEVVVVRRDAIVPIAIVVEAGAIEGSLRRILRTARRFGKDVRKPIVRKPIACDEPRNDYFSIVHPPPFALPRYAIAKRVKPALSSGRLCKSGDVCDRAAFVANQRPALFAEKSELRESFARP